MILSLLSSDYELVDLGGEGAIDQHTYVDWCSSDRPTEALSTDLGTPRPVLPSRGDRVS